MAKNIEPKLRKIGDYLQLDEETIFKIPQYQRAYSWETYHCDKLWQDILNYIQYGSKDNYFFGTIIINCEEDDTELGLVDGQQRTTTFLLLLKALLNRINIMIGRTELDEESEALCRGLKERRRRIMGILYKVETEEIPDKPDYARDKEICMRNTILVNESINELYKTELTTILQANDYYEAEANVVKIERKRKDNRYTKFFRNFKFFTEKVDTLTTSELNSVAKTVTDGCEVIEIKSWKVEQAINMFNSLNSDGLPLYDADIISAHLYSVADREGKKDIFTAKWKELLDVINILSESGIASIDSILIQQMYYERAVRKEIISESGSINVTTPGVRRYFMENREIVLKNPVELTEGMINLSKIWLKISSYPIAQVLLKFNENTKLFLASYFYRFKEEDVTEERIKTVLDCMLRLFALMEVVDIGYSSSLFKTFLFGEEVKFVDDTIDESEIKDDFDSHISAKWDRNSIKDAIMDYDKNMLIYLNEYLYANENDMDFEILSKYDIEHIMPASGKNLSEIRSDANIEDENEFNNIVNKLGNKILREERSNRAIGNEWFRSKISTKLGDKTGYVDSQYPIARALVEKYSGQGKPYWTKEDINNATEMAAERIVKYIFGE